MDAMWLNRELVDKLLDGVDFTSLEYVSGAGQYWLNGEPFTGWVKVTEKDGKLASVGQLKHGVEDGVAVKWYPNGQIKIYSELQRGVFHGWRMKWDADGTKREEKHYTRGRLDPA